MRNTLKINWEDPGFNKKLIEEYPFLKPRNVATGKDIEGYDYTWTWMNEMPEGWRKVFGLDMMKELKEILVKGNCLDSFHIDDIKEKWGILHFYAGGWSKEVDEEYGEWERKYEELSMLHCLNCGKETHWTTVGWINYVCDDCARKLGLDRCSRLTPDDMISYTIYDPRTGNQRERSAIFYERFKKQWAEEKE